MKKEGNRNHSGLLTGPGRIRRCNPTGVVPNASPRIGNAIVTIGTAANTTLASSVLLAGVALAGLPPNA